MKIVLRKLISAGTKDMAQQVGFDYDGKLVFKKGMHEMYHRFLDLNVDTRLTHEKQKRRHIKEPRKHSHNHTKR